jgi:hypothetical protein
MRLQLIGTWEIVSSADFDDEYLNLGAVKEQVDRKEAGC